MIGPSRFPARLSKQALAFGGIFTALLLGAATSASNPPHPAKLCVLRSALAGPTVRDDGLLYFRGQPDVRQSYIAAFKGEACRKLNPLAIVSLESDGDRVCEGDKVRAVMTVSQVPGPACAIDRLLPFAGDVDDALPADWLK
ncbi:hypothetical protein V474_14985 [Novosphingobium barchaimii LL02]|uniref:Uncharacterized protein n=1 Tax=Novosphingobium barchaimii LL02 TaxID=1114963 RepID=A0A0J7XYN8_9SPHN|nr:hypothetical protein [Novosphingobium barchaimii]KMS56654.1 hypothetical protein V474_14985 [Novosphingobium barchaimii LL02]